MIGLGFTSGWMMKSQDICKPIAIASPGKCKSNVNVKYFEC